MSPDPNPDPARVAGLAARQLQGEDLARALREARARTWTLVEDLTHTQWKPGYQRGVNPVDWELAHIAWFAEFWILRAPHVRDAAGFAQAARPPRFVSPDIHFDSAQLAHPLRWTTPMPSRADLKRLHADQLQACIDAIPDTRGLAAQQADAALYFHRLALFHEDMHAEAFVWMRSSLQYPAPAEAATPPRLDARGTQALHLPAATTPIGLAPAVSGFAFDNEQTAHLVTTGSFEIDSDLVSAERFAAFLDATGHPAPPRWQRAAGSQQGTWQIRWFDGWIAADHSTPAIHVALADAEAFCAWAGRRLPTAAEWEHAATQCTDFRWGHTVWEWTASLFNPYPGFAPGPYREYSQPWFGDHIELRGGAFATHARMHHPRYRNFFLPERSDIFAGFRTAAR